MATDYVNKVLLKGYVGATPELRFMPSGDSVCNFTLATRKGDKVEWHRLVAYDKNADKAKRDLDTGDLAYIEGSIQTREMITSEDKTAGRKPRKLTEIIISAVHLVEKKAAGTPAEPGTQLSSSESSDSIGERQTPIQDEHDQSGKLPGWLL
jgi:single-strand DNA-binding protein